MQMQSQTAEDLESLRGGILAISMWTQFPIKEEKIQFFSWNTFFAELGGTLSIIQILTFYIASIFIYDEYYRFMAKKSLPGEARSKEEEEARKMEIMNRISV